MNQFILPSKAVVYVTDVYCGWCWGFAERLAEFEAANRHRVDFATISGGLFTATRAKPFSRYPHIANANDRIARLTGAVFGAPYQRLLDAGEMVLDSSDAGAALAALRNQAPERSIQWAHLLQEAFYVRGSSLSDPGTAIEIASRHGLDAKQVQRALADGSAHRQAATDFALARILGASTYPTLLYVDGERVHPLPATAATLEDMNSRLDKLLA